MGKINDKNTKEILRQFLAEPPGITGWQKRQLNEGGEIVKRVRANDYQVEIRITFQGWQVTVAKGGVILDEASRQRPFG